MMKKLLSLFLAGTVAIFFTALGSGCAKKPKTPEVQEKKAEPKKDDGFKAVKEPSEAEKKQKFLSGLKLEDVNFDYNKYDIKADQKAKLQGVAQAMKGKYELLLTIEGHCDERGTNAYNRALGDKRANAALEYLYSLGVLRSRMTKISYGEEKPLCTEQTEECWQKNRRDHFLISEGGK